MLDFAVQAFPLWLIGLIVVVISILAHEAGQYLYRWSAAKQPDVSDLGKTDAEGFIVASIFGLLAFVVAVTFSIAVDRYDERRKLVTQDVNAISTTYLRASLFDEPHRSRLQSTLREYAESRIAPEGLWDERMEQQLKRSRMLRDKLWDETHAAVYPVRQTELGVLLVDAMNETLNVGEERELVGRAQVPSRIFDALFLYLFVAAGMLGYMLGDQSSRLRHASILLFVLFAVAFMLILDLDRPRAGTIQISQQPLEDLVAMMDRQAARAPAQVQAP